MAVTGRLKVNRKSRARPRQRKDNIMEKHTEQRRSMNPEQTKSTARPQCAQEACVQTLEWQHWSKKTHNLKEPPMRQWELISPRGKKMNRMEKHTEQWRNMKPEQTMSKARPRCTQDARVQTLEWQRWSNVSCNQNEPSMRYWKMSWNLEKSQYSSKNDWKK